MRPQPMLIVPPPGLSHNAYGIPGDCWRACLASLLGFDADDVPHFVAIDDLPDDPHLDDHGGLWYRASRRYVRRVTSLDLATWDAEVWRKFLETDPPDAPRYVIGSGPSPRGTPHSVIVDGRTLELVHDPRPGGDGLLEVEEVTALATPYDPPPPQEDIPWA